MQKILCGHRQTQADKLCLTAFFANWQASLHFLCRFIFSVCSDAGRKFVLVKKAQICSGDKFGNLQANRKKAPVNSMNIKSVNYQKN